MFTLLVYAKKKKLLDNAVKKCLSQRFNQRSVPNQK